MEFRQNTAPVSSEDVFPVGEIALRQYEGCIYGVRLEGTVDIVRLKPDGVIEVRDTTKDSGFWFNRNDSVWMYADGDLEVHIMYVGVIRILDVSPP